MEAPAGSVDEKEKVDWLFNFALVIKAINGALEVLFGILVLAIPPTLVLKLSELVTSGELATDPGDPIVAAIRSAAESFSIQSHYLLTIYLLLHGGIKVLLVIGIFMKKKIAYPLFMIALAIFGIYEVYRGFTRHELLLKIIGILDFLILMLTAYEYRRRYPTLPSFPGTRADYAER